MKKALLYIILYLAVILWSLFMAIVVTPEFSLWLALPLFVLVLIALIFGWVELYSRVMR